MDHIAANNETMEMALARYSVIAPLIARALTPQEYREELARIVACTHKFPPGSERIISERTVQRWHHWYQHGRSTAEGVSTCPPGLEALKPAPREDRAVHGFWPQS